MPETTKTSVRRRDRVVEALLFAALALQLLLLVALVLHGPGSGAPENLVGSVGSFAAAMLYGGFGVLSYLLLALSLWTTVLLLARREVTSPRWRIAGFGLFVIGGCTLVHQFFPRGDVAQGRTQILSYDPGGAIGALGFAAMLPAFGTIGTFLVSVVLLCTGLAFATDWLLYEMAWVGVRRAGSLFGLLRRFWPEPVVAAAAADASASVAVEDDASEIAKPVVSVALDEPDLGPAHMESSSLAPSPLAADPFAPEFPEPAARPVPNPSKFDVFGDDLPAFAMEDPVLDVPADLAERLAPQEPVAAPAQPAREPVAAPVAPVADEAPTIDTSAETADDDDAIADDEVAAAADDDADAAQSAPFVPVHVPAAVAPAADVQRPAPQAKKYRLQGLKVEKPRAAGEYEYPTSDLLERPKPRNVRQLEQAIQANAEVLARTLTEFKIDGQVVAYQQGPVVTMLEVALAPGTKVTKIHALSEDLAMALKAESVRVVAPIPGKSTVGVEIPNPVRDDVRMLSLLEAPEFRATKCAIPMLLGSAADGRPLIEDLATMPHLLIAGSTGSGKSVCINTLLLSILLTRTPDEVRLILIDPKQVELAFFADVPHLLSPVVTDMKRASAVLEWALDKMEERYDLFRRFEVRNIASYNELGEEAILRRAKELEIDDEVVQVRLPYVVIIVDELADLMLTVGKDIETAVTRLAQKSRAVGIHVVLATQRPSTDVITGLIKANMPTRIAFKVASKVDSRVILDVNGAEKLLGMGDMLYMPPRSSTISRAQGTYASDREVKRVVSFLRERYTQDFSDELVNLSSAPMLDSSEKDELYDQAVRIVLQEQRGSASLLQRALSIGYTRASRLLDLMRAEGVVGAYKGSKASDVQMTIEEYEARVAAHGGRTSSSDDDGGDM